MERRTVQPDHYLVIDLEATCCNAGSIPREETEIIEIGAVMVDADTLAVVDEFAAFVRPQRHTKLTGFCTELTSIQQADVDSAKPLDAVLADFNQWARQYDNFLFSCWGDYDYNQMTRECRDKGIPYPFAAEHLNLKRQFAQRQGLRRKVGMAAALRKVGLPLVGTHHRGIDDARNIARLLPYIVGRQSVGGES